MSLKDGARRVGALRVGAVVLCSAIVATACETKPREVYEIPDGYGGWVEVRAKRSECPALRGSRDATVFVVPQSGVVCTSSAIAHGLGREEYYYVGPRTRVRLRSSAADPRSMIWNVEYYGSGGAGPDYERQRDRLRFFVGTKTQYAAAMQRR